MNQFNKDKVKNFFRKDGFYFILILCLCVVAVATTFAMRNNNNKADNEEDTANEFTLNIEDEEEADETSNTEIPNADRVEENTNNQLAETENNQDVTLDTQTETEEVSTEEESTQTSATVTEVIFQLPIEGELARSYENQMIKVSSNEEEATYVSRGGIDVAAKIDSIVKVAADGIVEEVANTPKNGNYVVIAHANGLKTIYCNLDENITVAEGDSVTCGTELGTVGNSSMIFTEDICGDVLNLQIEDGNGKSVDPNEYFNF